MTYDSFIPRFEKFVYALILYSVGMFFVEAHMGGVDSLHGPAIFLWSERFVAMVLTGEMVLRFVACSSRTSFGTDETYFRSPEMVFDMIAVAPFWLGFVVPAEYLPAVRAARILRLLKFYRASPVAHMVVGNLMTQWKKIRLVNAFVFIMILFSGTVMHQLESAAQPEAFHSLWASIWWAVVTLTTVGYGDMSPVTTAGQLVAMLLMVTGIGVVGAMISIIGSAFDVEDQEDDEYDM